MCQARGADLVLKILCQAAQFCGLSVVSKATMRSMAVPGEAAIGRLPAVVQEIISTGRTVQPSQIGNLDCTPHSELK